MVQGPALLRNGKPVVLEGLNVPSLEWSNEGENVLRSTDVAITQWISNCIRLPLAQDRWFGKAPGQTDGGEAYRKLVRAVLDRCKKSDVALVLDLHWSNGGVWGKQIRQHKMPDEHSVSFWVDVAKRYRDEPLVLFDLYNEPRDVSWEVWRNGGDVTDMEDGKEIRYRTPGMQGLLQAIRKAGAKNVIVAGGLDWAYDLTGIVNGFALRDPNGNGVMYASHIYPWKSDWEGKVGICADRHPVLVGEVGCEPDPKQEAPETWAPRMLEWIKKRKLHWTAWCFHPSASPRMLLNWEYEPTPYWGAPVKALLTGNRRQ
jgi:hypothetical protein